MGPLHRVSTISAGRRERRWAAGEQGSRISRSLKIYPKALFLDLVRYERLRCDRLNTPLSLVVVPVSGEEGRVGTPDKPESAFDIVGLLVQRVRSSDSVGWFDAKRVAILLPVTSLEGARRFVALLLSDLPRRCTPVEISTYPNFDDPGRGAADVEARGGGTTVTVTHDGVTHVEGTRHEQMKTGHLRVYESGHEEMRRGYSGAADSVIPGVDIEQIIVRPVPRWKRTTDVAGALAGLAVCVPVFLLVAGQIKLVSPGPVLFRQQRVGRGGRLFTFYKFRTMHCDNDESFHNQHAADFIRSNGAMTKLDETDPRIIPGGRILRVLCIDELPQLYNVLRGDMSLVGPRPCIPYEAAEYQRWHRHRFSILPGLTGLWQVSGKNRLSFAEMIKLDIAYERNMSPMKDLVIILRTIPTIFGLLFEAIGRRIRRNPPESVNGEKKV